MHRRVSRQIDFENDTVVRVVAAAKQLFAEFGHENVSLRRLTECADVNVAAVNYHFGSKQGLTEAVFEQLAEEATTIRKTRLAAWAAMDIEPREKLEELISIFLEPYLGEGRDVEGRLLSRFFLQHRLKPTDGTNQIIETFHNPIALDFVQALSELRPRLNRDELIWRYIFMVNTVILTCAEDTSFKRITVLSGGEVTKTGRFERRTELLKFLVSAFWD
ncbi:MAG: TetR family transcriptional regulator [Pseudomonadota bacterium]|nr:TetR family transcriptional regulator [Pseudomonadota bacterium]